MNYSAVFRICVGEKNVKNLVKKCTSEASKSDLNVVPYPFAPCLAICSWCAVIIKCSSEKNVLFNSNLIVL